MFEHLHFLQHQDAIKYHGLVDQFYHTCDELFSIETDDVATYMPISTYASALMDIDYEVGVKSIMAYVQQIHEKSLGALLLSEFLSRNMALANYTYPQNAKQWKEDLTTILSNNDPQNVKAAARANIVGAIRYIYQNYEPDQALNEILLLVKPTPHDVAEQEKVKYEFQAQIKENYSKHGITIHFVNQREGRPLIPPYPQLNGQPGW